MRSGASLRATGLTRSHGAFVVLDGVDLSVGPRSRIGVVGPNGVGKTTLLRILAGLERPDAGQVMVAPPGLTVGYLPQETVARPAWPERTGGPGETLAAYLARRTGVAAAEAELEEAAAGLDADGPAAADAGDRYTAALDRYLALGGPDLEARAGAVCADVGLPADRMDVELGALSGGQAARAALAAILLSRFDVFLLDEPTNDLDFAGLDRLERFLGALDGGLVVVSHDRAFLEVAVDRVVELDEHSRTATEFGGGWLAYLEARATARRHATDDHAEYRSQHSSLTERARTQRQWANVGVAKAKRSPPDNDKNRRNITVNRTEKQAAKVRITEKALDRLAVVDKPWEGWDLQLELSAATRSGDVVARLTGAVVDLGPSGPLSGGHGSSGPLSGGHGPFRLGPLDLEIAWAERVAVTGPNGSGKTTLLRALLGQLPLSAGDRWLGPGVVVGELDQGRRAFVGDRPLLRAFEEASGLLTGDTRSLLAKFGLGATHVERPAGSLSPGERTRATLALLMARGANCLVLDEPTNHLDLPAIEQLERALDRYDGTLLVVTHDRRLLEALRTTRRIDLGAGGIGGGRVDGLG